MIVSAVTLIFVLSLSGAVAKALDFLSDASEGIYLKSDFVKGATYRFVNGKLIRIDKSSSDEILYQDGYNELPPAGGWDGVSQPEEE